MVMSKLLNNTSILASHLQTYAAKHSVSYKSSSKLFLLESEPNHRIPNLSLGLKVSIFSDENLARIVPSGGIRSLNNKVSFETSDSHLKFENTEPVNQTRISFDEIENVAFQTSELSQETSLYISNSQTISKNVQRKSRRHSERLTYLAAAIFSSVGFIALAGGAVFYRFFSQMQTGIQMPYLEMFGTFALAVGAAVGMEYWARWAHKALWHDSLWYMHESHHRPRDGPFELNDIFAIINAVPAILLLAYGFFNKGIIPGMCFGAGLGITLFGMAYMFVHDGLVHRRFSVGPVANIPYLQRVAAAHQLHHADKYEGVPFGLFLGPQELQNVGGLDDLETMLKIRQAQLKN